jgi:hypothetical protein
LRPTDLAPNLPRAGRTDRAAWRIAVEKTTSVLGLFESREAAGRAIRTLHDRGFAREQISVAMRDTEEQAALAQDLGASEPAEAASAGAVGGGILGGLAGLLVGIGALTVPGIGPILAAGPLAGALGTTLAGAGIGAAAGGMVGALAGIGVPPEHAECYAEGVRRGGTLVSVQTDGSNAAEAVAVMRAAGALDVESRRAGDRGNLMPRAEPALIDASAEESGDGDAAPSERRS